MGQFLNEKVRECAHEMSNYTYNKLWHDTQRQLESVAVQDFENQALEPQFEKPAAQTAIFELYVKYICIANKLEEIYDQMVQPQKRLLVRKILDSCLGRVVELKGDLVNIDIMEFSYNDEVIERLGLTPLDIEIKVPRYFRREREKELAARRETMDEILKKMGFLDEQIEEEKMTELEAIRVIQMHERARQGRLRAQFMKEIRLLKEKGKPESGKDKADSGLIAAMKIQKLTQLRYSIQAKYQEEFQKALQDTKRRSTRSKDLFNETWRDKDETMNAKQSHYEDMIFNEKYAEVEEELRKVVDDMMRQELELLQAALDRDRAQKGKKVKKSNKKARRSGKKGKKKKEKDLTPDRTTESLFEELFINGIIKKYPETPLKSYLGDRSYVERSGVNPTPGDIRQVITELCILPLGSEMVRNFAPCIRSILLTGSKGSGKHTLVNAICTEVGGTLFDLTPANIVGKYPGKSGLIMLMHLVSKVSRLLQPSVIYTGDAEKPFMKKIPKTDRTDPKTVEKRSTKVDQKLLQQAYNRFIYIPRPDYGTLSYAWKTLLSQYSGVQPTFDSGAMAKISDGYTIGSVVKCLKEVITCKRMLQLRLQPLTHVELINSLSTKDPVYREEEEAFLTWWGKTPLGRRRQRVLELEMEARIEKENASDKAKKGAKKKNDGSAFIEFQLTSPLTQLRYSIQAKYQEEFQKALQDTKEEINTKQGSVISEDIADEIRNWFKEYKGRTGKLPDFPSEEHGGSRHLLSRQGTESEMSRSSAPSSKESKKAKEKSKSAIKSGDINVEDTFENGYKASQSSFLPELKTGIEEFNETWRDKDETMNAKQSHYEDMIFNEKYAEVEEELRKVVDDMMRQELELLQAALDRDRAQKGKKVKKSNKKARRSGKKGKKKKEKDLTPDRTTESLFEELFINGIIKKYPETPLKSYLGDRSYVERSGVNPTPGDIRQVITELCILPLGSEMVRNFAPCIRSILLTGSKGSGKHTLVNAICTEVGGTLFDLTPANIVGKYPGKSGLIMLMHLLVKNIGPEDRVIFIGTSCAPWEADQKLLQQAYNRFIYIPRPDYGTLSYAWKTLLSQYSGVQPTFDSGAMAKISDGYTIGSVVKCLKEVITCKRMLQLRLQPLTHVELINSLSTKDPVYREEEEAFLTWWGKTPLGRRRQRVLELEMEARIEKENASDKAKKGAKKKK
uniref:Putative aaa+-type atpase n=1 Tax=Lutzomyia longipalpis TaxID=7200 RepID=A0A1B0CRU6_LUTLO